MNLYNMSMKEIREMMDRKFPGYRQCLNNSTETPTEPENPTETLPETSSEYEILPEPETSPEPEPEMRGIKISLGGIQAPLIVDKSGIVTQNGDSFLDELLGRYEKGDSWFRKNYKKLPDVLLKADENIEQTVEIILDGRPIDLRRGHAEILYKANEKNWYLLDGEGKLWTGDGNSTRGLNDRRNLTWMIGPPVETSTDVNLMTGEDLKIIRPTAKAEMKLSTLDGSLVYPPFQSSVPLSLKGVRLRVVDSTEDPYVIEGDFEVQLRGNASNPFLFIKNSQTQKTVWSGDWSESLEVFVCPTILI